MLRTASRSPVKGCCPAVNVGLKTTAALQVLPGVKVVLVPEAPQGFVAAGTTVKLALLTERETFMFAEPLLVATTVFCALWVPLPCSMLPKVKLVAESDRAGPLTLAVPLSETFCLLPVTLSELSVMVRVPLSVPVPVGANVTVIVQLAKGASELAIGQLFACW